jgi:hypothetical protein
MFPKTYLTLDGAGGWRKGSGAGVDVKIEETISTNTLQRFIPADGAF